MYVDSRGSLAPSREYHVRRREPRYVSSIPVTLQRFLRYGPAVTRGMSLDISMRGMSALVCGAPRVRRNGGDCVVRTRRSARHSSRVAGDGTPLQRRAHWI